MVSLLPFTRSRRSTNDALTASSPSPGGGGGGTMARAKAALSGVTGGGGGGGGGGRLVPGMGLPHVTLPTLKGGHIEIGAPTGQWNLMVLHRGRACPISRNYLASLASLAPDFNAAGVEIVAISADTRDKAEDMAARLAEATGAAGRGAGTDLGFKVAYGLPVEAMAAWGLYASAPTAARAGGGFGGAAAASDAGVVCEPAVICVDPDGAVYFVDVASSPFTRPDLAILLESCRFFTTADYPVRGTLEV